MSDPRVRQFKFMGMLLLVAALMLVTLGLVFLFGLDLALIGGILLAVGVADLGVGLWFLRRGAALER